MIRLLLWLLLPSIALASPATLSTSAPPPNGPGTITIFSSDSTQKIKLPNANCGPATSNCWGEWSPDGTKLTFQSALTGQGSGIYTIWADGSHLVRLTASPNKDAAPSYSPDGTKIVFNFVTNPASNPQTIDIYIMNADGTGRTALTTNASGVYSIEPHISALGKICYISNSAGPTTQDLWIMNLDGSSPTRYTTTGRVGDPEWSPTGDTIAMSADQTTPDSLNIWTINADGTNFVQVTNCIEPDECGVPSYNYNATQFAFEYDRGGNIEKDSKVPAYVGFVNTDGTNLYISNIPCSILSCHPKWSWH